jgi:alpha/beta superfamily hydrolase
LSNCNYFRQFFNRLNFYLAIVVLFFIQTVQIATAATGYMTTTDGKSIYYEVAGTGTPLLLIHGGDCVGQCSANYSASVFKASASWDAQFSEFAKTFKVIRFDVRGFGKSSKVTPHPIDSWGWWGKADRTTVDVVELMSYLNITKAHVVGLSIGSGIASQLAVYYPQLVDKLILVSPWIDHTFTFTSKEASSLNAVLSKTLLILGRSDYYAISEADYAKTEFNYNPTRTLLTGGHFCNSDSPADFNKTVLNFLPTGSSGTVPTGAPATNRLGGISTRSYVGTNPMDYMIAGILVSNTAKKVVARASSVDGILNPKLSIKTYPAGTVIYSNNDWVSGMSATELQQKNWAPAKTTDAALIVTLQPGLYTVEVSPESVAGVGIVEVYELDTAGKLGGISTRSHIDSNPMNYMIAGVLVQGDAKRLIVRAVSVDGIFDPKIDIKTYPAGTIIYSNTDWAMGASATELQQLKWNPSGTKDAALSVTLSPGLYTAEVSPQNGVAGVGLVEVYEHPTYPGNGEKSSSSGGNTTPVVDSCSTASSGTTLYNKCQTERLIGAWNFTYKMVSTSFTDSFTLPASGLKGPLSTADGEEYQINGTDKNGNQDVGARYSISLKKFTLLNQGLTINEFFVFDLTADNSSISSGCYYLIDKSTEKWSDCYSLSGVKTGNARRGDVAFEVDPITKEMQVLQEHNMLESSKQSVRSGSRNLDIDPMIIEVYQQLKQ